MILACDPGLTGAFAFYDGDVLRVKDMPTYKRPAGQRGVLRPFPDRPEIIRQLGGCKLMGGCEWLIMEQVGGVPGQAAHAAFTFGHGAGFITGAALAMGYKVEEVSSVTWKTAMKCPRDKADAVAFASTVFPAYANLWAAVRGNGSLEQRSGRAEAALLALYGWQIKGPQA